MGSCGTIKVKNWKNSQSRFKNLDSSTNKTKGNNFQSLQSKFQIAKYANAHKGWTRDANYISNQLGLTPTSRF